MKRASLGLLATVLVSVASTCSAQAAGLERPWSLRTRAVMSGSSDHSSPAGYKVYSGIALEAAVERAFTRYLSAGFSLRTESREVDRNDGLPQDTRLGSLELLPINVVLKVQPPWESFLHPYAGVGMNLTLCWEKSGALDNTRVSTGLSPVVTLGLDIELSTQLLLNVDLKLHKYRADITDKVSGTKTASLDIDPLSVGLGLGLRF